MQFFDANTTLDNSANCYWQTSTKNYEWACTGTL